MYETPTSSDFKLYFDRDFPFGTDKNTSIVQSDIDRAHIETNNTIREGLFPTQELFTMAHHYLTAHNLSMNIRNSNQGLNGQFEGVLGSKSVGSVSTSMNYPIQFLDDPTFSIYLKTTYGAKYLEIVYPLLKGAMFIVEGKTQP